MSDAIGVVNKAGLALLKSNAEKGIECSAGETLKLIEALEIGHKQIFELHDQLAVSRLTLKQSQAEVVRLKVELELQERLLESACKVMEEVSDTDTGTGGHLEDLCLNMIAEINDGQ